MDIIVPVDIGGRFISTNVPADEAEEYDPYKIYLTGSIVQVGERHTIYICLSDVYVDDNNESHKIKGYYPPDYLVSAKNTYPWKDLRSDNKFAAIDKYINTQTSNPGSIVYNFISGGCDSVALLNIEATSVEAILYDESGRAVWTEVRETYTTVDTVTEWFFSEPIFKSNLFFSFPLGIGGVLHLTIANSVGTAKCGVISMGRLRSIGITKDEISISMTDYSEYETDSIGRTTIMKGLYSDIHKFTVFIDKPLFSYIKRMLDSLRATLLVWIVDNVDDPNDSDSALITLGWFTNLDRSRRNARDTFDITIGGAV